MISFNRIIFYPVASFFCSSIIAVESPKHIFFEATVDKQQVYVQQQVLLTIKIFKVKNPPGTQFTGPLIKDAIVEKIAEDILYSETIDDRKYLVREKNYVVFPQKSGLLNIVNRIKTPHELTIERHTVNNWAYDGDLLPSYFEKMIQIDVKPIQKGFSDIWLPSKQISLEESGINSDAIWKVNEPVTWDITLSAQGLSENQLPNIFIPKTDGITTYLELIKKIRTVDSLGVLGKRKFRITVIPNKAGEISLPVVEIKWWNTRTNQQDVSRTKERKITVNQF